MYCNDLCERTNVTVGDIASCVRVNTRPRRGRLVDVLLSVNYAVTRQVPDPVCHVIATLILTLLLLRLALWRGVRSVGTKTTTCRTTLMCIDELLHYTVHLD